MQNETAFDEIETKPRKRAERMLRSDSARRRRKALKVVKETRILNEWAKARRARKRK